MSELRRTGVNMRTRIRAKVLDPLTRSRFVRNVATLSGGEMAAIAIPLLAAPIVGRLYTPAEYGPLATYMAFSALGGSLAVLQFDRAIVPETQIRALHVLVTLCFSILAGVVVLSVFVSLGVYYWMGTREVFLPVRGWIMALPLSVFMTGFTLIVSELAIRFGRFRPLARFKMVSITLSVLTQIGLGLLNWGPAGLISAYLVSQSTMLLLAAWLFFFAMRFRPSPLSLPRLHVLFRRHKNFAIFTTPSRLMIEYVQQIPVLALTFIGAVGVLGAFSRARQLIFLPLTLIGRSIAQVFRSHAMQQARSSGSFHSLFVKMFGSLLIAGVPALVAIWIFAPIAFTLYLGKQWEIAGEVARLIAPLLILRMMSGPLGSVYNLTGHQRHIFIQSIGAAVIGTAIASALIFFDGPPNAILIGYVVSYGGLCVTSIFFAFGISKRFTITRITGSANEAEVPAK